MFVVDIVNILHRSVCSSQYHVELGTPCSCMGVPVVWISQWELMLIFVTPEVCVAVQDSYRARKRTFSLWELLSGCPVCSGSAMLGEVIWMSQHLYVIVKYE